MIGQRIGNYHVVRLLSEGSAAVVYEALHRRTKQQAAIRVLREDLSQDQLAGARLFNDVAALGGVQHRSVLTVHEAGMLPDGAAYVVMEYIEGHTLSARLRGEGGDLDGAVALSIAWQLAGALRAAHQRGVLHGDLRPDGVLLVAEQAAPAGVRVKIPDLGLAWIDRPIGVAGRLSGADVAPIFLAPEQLHEAGETTPLSDVFAVGGVLYLLLSGRPPFSPRGAADAMTTRLVPLRELDESIPAELAGLVESMLHTNPVQRPDMEEVATALERLVIAEGLVPGPAPAPGAGGGKRRGRRLALAAGMVVAAAVGGLVAVGVRTGWRPSGAASTWFARPTTATPAPAQAIPTPAPAPAPQAQAATDAAPAAPPAAPTPMGPPAPDPPQAAGPPVPPELAGAPSEPVAVAKVPVTQPAPGDGPAAQRPAPVAVDKAPIPPLRLDIKGPPPKKKPTKSTRSTKPTAPSDEPLSDAPPLPPADPS